MGLVPIQVEYILVPLLPIFTCYCNYELSFSQTTVDLGMVLKVQKQGCAVMSPYIVQPHSAVLAMEPACKGVTLFPTSCSCIA